MTFTVLGASGFIGSHLVRWLHSQSVPYWAPGRGEDVLSRPLGHVVYCIGLTADFRQRPFDAMRAHVCQALDILEKATFESFLYLSTTRVYAGAPASSEDATLRVNPLQPGDLYNISKLAGESLCLSSSRPTVRVARLSNVLGRDFSSENFLSYVIREAVEEGKVVLRTTPASEKDYISIDDVVRLLPQIAQSGRHRIYNVASGANTSNGALLEVIQQSVGCVVEVAQDAQTIAFPPVLIERIREEFNFVPAPVLHSLEGLIAEYQKRQCPIDKD